jgi:hypothetical protein
MLMYSACGVRVYVEGKGPWLAALPSVCWRLEGTQINTESNITTALDDLDKDSLQNIPDYKTVLLHIAVHCEPSTHCNEEHIIQ